MPARNNSRLRRPCFRSAVILCLLTLAPTAAAQIHFGDVRLYLNDDRYHLATDIRYEFSTDVVEALAHGVALRISTELRVHKQRRWLWDQRLLAKELLYRLEYHVLSGQYLLTEQETGRRRHFRSLEDVLEDMGRLSDIPLIEAGNLAPKHSYVVSLRTRLDIEELPAPLNPLAYVRNNWSLISPWLELKLRQ